jgi:hypothetical protein
VPFIGAIHFYPEHVFAVGAGGGHNCIHALPEFTVTHPGNAEDSLWLFL